MTAARRPLIAGNWKMNGLRQDGMARAADLAARVRKAGAALECDIVLCPPATLVQAVADSVKGSAVAVGGQDCHAKASGAHTGDIGAAMLADAGCRYVIVGHSERRAAHGEGDAEVRGKAQAVHAAGMVAIVCVGESEVERDAGRALSVVERQVAGSVPDGATPKTTVVAYEPIWAIGTGRTPTPEQIAEVHGAIRAALAKRFGGEMGFRILYGGSVKASNAKSILTLADVDGALVGGASLDPAEFWGIVESCP